MVLTSGIVYCVETSEQSRETHANNVGEFDMMSVHRDCVDTATLQRIFDMQVHTGLPESYSPSAHIDKQWSLCLYPA